MEKVMTDEEKWWLIYSSVIAAIAGREYAPERSGTSPPSIDISLAHYKLAAQIADEAFFTALGQDRFNTDGRRR